MAVPGGSHLDLTTLFSQFSEREINQMYVQPDSNAGNNSNCCSSMFNEEEEPNNEVDFENEVEELLVQEVQKFS